MKIVELGRLIEQTNNRNHDKSITIVKGLSTKKEFRTPQSRVNYNELGNYKILLHNHLAFVPTTDTWRCLAVAISKYEYSVVVSPIYCTFRIIDESVLLPDYLYLWLTRPEMDRYARFHSWGSARENFNFADMQRVRIPVPDMETQQRLVAVWSGLDGMKRDNDAQAAPLMELCMSYLKKLREEYPLRALSDNLIERVERFNSNAILGIDSVRGVSNTKEIIQTRANVSGREVKDFLVLNHHEFIFNRRTTRNGERLGLGFNESDTPILFTNDYVMFKVKDEDVLLPEFLYLCFKRDEFDRYVRWDSWGSATEFFNWENMQRVRIPIPPKAIQQAIVDIYTCAKECRDIAEQADNLRRVAGPALMQKAIHP